MSDIRRCAAIIAVAVAACVAVLPGTSAAAVQPAAGAQGLAPSGIWGKAQEVPGTATLNSAGRASLSSVSCASAGNCSAGGYYTTGSAQEAFVVSEAGGTWGKAQEVPGIAALNAGNAGISSVSCASPGNCSAGGSYTDGQGRPQVFVATEAGGTWQKAEEVPGTGTLNQGGTAGLTSVSCASAGNCSAGGYYTDGSSHLQAFVVSEAGGTWHEAEEVPGTATLNHGEGAGAGAEVLSVSCATAGNCSAGGYYSAGFNDTQPFVVSEAGGTWRKAEEMPGTATLEKGGYGQVNSVSCASAGNCSAGGAYSTMPQRSDTLAFVVSEAGGTWQEAEAVPGIAALSSGGGIGGGAEVSSVSCASAGNCGAGGSYTTQSGQEAFVVSEAGGTWHKAGEVPGLVATGLDDSVNSVSCASAGYCSAGGYYYNGGPGVGQQAFVVGEAGGRWQEAEEVPGLAALSSQQNASVSSVSCASAGNCSAGGNYYAYLNGSGTVQAFVVSETLLTPTSTALTLSAPKVTYGHEQAEDISAKVTAASGTPAGRVTVKAGSSTLCAITLSGGKGACAVPATKYNPGTVRLTASYAGGGGFTGSASAVKAFTVTTAASRTALALSATRVTFGHEQSERLSVAVSPQYAGTPGGKVMVTAGNVAVCVITLRSAKGSCALSAKALTAGTYHLTASYPGNADFAKSASTGKTLTVVK